MKLIITRMFKGLFGILLLVLLALGTTGCPDDDGAEETLEETGETMDEAAEDVGEAGEEAGEEIEDAGEDVMNR